MANAPLKVEQHNTNSNLIGGHELSPYAEENLKYITRMLHELRSIAQGVDDGTMVYLLEMAYIHGEEEILRLGLKT